VKVPATPTRAIGLTSAALLTLAAVTGCTLPWGGDGAGPPVPVPTFAPAVATVTSPEAPVLLSLPSEVSDQAGATAVVVVKPRHGRVPAGRVEVRDGADDGGGGHLVGAADATAATQQVRVEVHLDRLGSGTHRLRAAFIPDSGTTRSSAPVTVTSRAGCVWSPSSCGFPDAATTGVPTGTRLTPSGSITVKREGAVLENLDITGTLTIKASHVTVRNTRVRSGGYAVITVDPSASDVTLTDVDVIGNGLAGSAGSSGIVGTATVSGARVSGVENGFLPGSGSRISGSYVARLAAPGKPHYDGVQIDGDVHDVTLSDTTIDLSEHDQTSAVMVDNYYGPVSAIAVDHNLLAGGGFTVYADGSFSTTAPITGVAYTRNRVAAGSYGTHVVRNASTVWTDNVVDGDGQALDVTG
jgi:hypothetical protein